MNDIIVLCSECKNVPINAAPKFGDAKAWDGILICAACAKKLGKTIRQAWKEMEIAK